MGSGESETSQVWRTWERYPAYHFCLLMCSQLSIHPTFSAHLLRVLSVLGSFLGAQETAGDIADKVSILSGNCIESSW